MMKSHRRVHVLTAGFSSPNGRAFLMPLILHRRSLADFGISIRFFYERSADICDCDALLIESKFYGPRWVSENSAVLDEFAVMRDRVANLIFMDIHDSAGWDHVRMLPHVTLFCKAQILKDRSNYLRPLYGYRVYSDYYHRSLGAIDNVPVESEPIKDPSLLDKFALSWNSGLADYSWLGPYRMAAYERLPLRMLLRFPNRFCPPSSSRRNDFHCRIGTRYVRRSVSFQREQMAQKLSRRMNVGKISRRRYLAELSNSRVIASPFGLGEITLRDFEIFMSGGLLLKPDMSTIETWPNFYSDGESMIAHRWDLSDLEERIDFALADNERRIAIAQEGQNRYRQYVSGPDAGRIFAEHFAGILAKSERKEA